MNLTTYKISLDVQKRDTQVFISAIRGDTNRVIEMSLTDNGKPFDIEEGSKAFFTAVKPDGSYFDNEDPLYNACVVGTEKNIITYKIDSQAVAVSGEVKCQIRLTDNGGGILSTPSFSIIVGDTLYNEAPIVESSEEFNALTAYLADLQKKLADGEFKGEKGDKGDTGSKGEKGDTGAAGKDGKDADVTLLSNALKGYSNGGFLTDISPIEHNIVCRVKSKNKIPNSALDLAGWTNTKFNTYYFYSIELEAGKTYCLSGYSNSTTGKYDYLYLMKSNDNFSTTSNVIQLFRDSTHNNGKTFVAEEGYKYAFYYYGAPERFSQYYNLMIEEGTSITQYAPMLEDLTQAGIAYANDGLDINEQFVYADENGDIEGIVSHYPLMTFRLVYTTIDVSTESAVLEITYNRDINKAFEELKNAIISLGGNV